MLKFKKSILTHMILMNALFIILMAFSGMHKAEAATTIICSNSTVPSGYVVTQVRRNDNYCTSRHLEYTIEFPYPGINMCSATPLPYDYGVTYARRNDSVCTNFYLLYRIEPIRDNIDICSVPRGPTHSASPVPAGYGVTYARRNDNVCTNSYLLFRTEKLRDNLNICSVPRGPTGTDSPVPEEFVATYIQRNENICTNFYSQYTINEVIGSSMQMCDVSLAPNNYVITGTQTNSRSCDIFDLHYIEPINVPFSADFSVRVQSWHGFFWHRFYTYTNASTTGFPQGSSLTYTWTLTFDTGAPKIVVGSAANFSFTTIIYNFFPFYTKRPSTLALTVTDGTRTTNQVIKTLQY